MQRCEVEIANPQGLNAAASAKLVQLAATYLCDVALARSGRRVNAKSLMGAMMLAAGKGCRVVVETEGPDEIKALDAVVSLVASPKQRRLLKVAPGGCRAARRSGNAWTSAPARSGRSARPSPRTSTPGSDDGWRS